jgi:hypothetical protein
MKKIGILLLVLVIAIGALGVGYAHWWDWTFIRGEVNTGELCVGITGFTEYDDCVDDATGNPGVLFPQYTNPNDPDFDGEYDVSTMGVDVDRYDKNVACCAFELVNPREGVLHEGDQVYTILSGALYNGYPSYWNLVDVQFANCGTVPAGLRGVWIRPIYPDGSLGPWTMMEPDPKRNGTVDADGNYPYVYAIDMDDDGVAEVNVWTHWPGQDPTAPEWINQLDPCDRTTLWFDIHVNQQADENATYNYYVAFGWVNWNQLSLDPGPVNPNPGG